MDAIRGLSGVLGVNRVNEHNARGKREDAFRRALQEHGEAAGDGTAAEREPEPQAQPHANAPVRRGLQPQRPDDRKQDGEALHVDVIA